MPLDKENFYHPFTKSELAFLADDTFSKGNGTTQFLLEEVGLYSQPVEEPVTGIIYLVIGIFMLIVRQFIQFEQPKFCKNNLMHLKNMILYFTYKISAGITHI